MAANTQSAQATPRGLGLYVHVPFCVHKCGYCDFNSWAETRRAPMERWTQALERQVKFWSERLQKPQLETVFFGGGTPSLLENDLLERVGRLLRESFSFAPAIEFTAECNPETLDRAKLDALRALGANRLSVGVQSFQDRFLERLERHARQHDNERALELVATEWKGRWSLDLMFGLPTQSSDDWNDDLKRALKYRPQHISAYQLTLTTARSKAWQQPPEDDLLRLFDETESWLQSEGLEHYEISNFALKGEESRHNLKYWRLEPFLGVGPGAAGLLPGSLADVASRFGVHQRQPERFETWFETAGTPGGEIKQLEPRRASDHLAEMMMMGFRLREGLPEGRFGAFAPHLGRLWSQEQELGFIGFHEGRWTMTPKGLRILDSLLPRLLQKLEKDAGRDLDLKEIDPTFW